MLLLSRIFNDESRFFLMWKQFPSNICQETNVSALSPFWIFKNYFPWLTQYSPTFWYNFKIPWFSLTGTLIFFSSASGNPVLILLRIPCLEKLTSKKQVSLVFAVRWQPYHLIYQFPKSKLTMKVKRSYRAAHSNQDKIPWILNFFRIFWNWYNIYSTSIPERYNPF